MKNIKESVMELVYHGDLTADEGMALYKKLMNPGNDNAASMDIAIVGMSGRFPKADDVNEYWDNLIHGVDCIQEISSRWNIEDIYESGQGTNNKSYSKWGGLLKNYEDFEPLFFELSPRQAELMEPRQRIFMLESYKALEDAGFTESEVNGTKCGIFIGCEGSTNYFKDMDCKRMNGHVVMGHSNSILSARLSYFLNLQGPSVTIDTACSSSLVAIHQACCSIINHDSEMAIAGGATIMTDPYNYPLLCNMNMLSPTGKCHTFDESADGFVPGECVAAIVLMPLQKAIEKKCHIYGVIKASGINQDGKTNGMTAPSAKSQERLERRVYETYEINPKTISYVEAHGTGTRLGDPLEIEALTKAFKYQKNEESQYCAIGSVKTNIGHAAASSGIASVIKVLLSMQHKEIPPLLNFEKHNLQINFKESPFRIVNQKEEWIPKNFDVRRAAVSSFGYSGTNCHMVIDEYVNQQEEMEEQHPYYLIPFSAKTKKAFHNKLEMFRNYLCNNEENTAIDEISYNLLVYRTHFSQRGCFIVRTIQELKDALNKVLNNETSDMYVSNDRLEHSKYSDQKVVKNENIDNKSSDDDYKVTLESLRNRYLNFEDIPWNQLWKKQKQRISLPTYPFDDKKYGLNDDDVITTVTKTNKSICSLIDSDHSNDEYWCFKKTLYGDEFFIQNHNQMMPGVVTVEMVYQACKLSLDCKKTIFLSNLVWNMPITVSEHPVDLYVLIHLKTNQNVHCEVVSYVDNNKVIHFQADATYGEKNIDVEQIRIQDIIKNCEGGIEPAKYFYHCLDKMGIGNGPLLQGMKEFFYNKNQAIVKLENEEILKDSREYYLHPTLLDGGLHSTVNWLYHSYGNTERIYLPFSARKLHLLDMTKKPCYAYMKIKNQIKQEDVQTIAYDIKYLDALGNVLVYLEDFYCREFKPEVFFGKVDDERKIGPLYYNEGWGRKEIENHEQIKNNKTCIIFDYDDKLLNQLKTTPQMQGVNIILVLQGKSYKSLNDYTYTIDPENKADFKQLITQLYKDKQRSYNFIFNLENETLKVKERMTLGINCFFCLCQVMMNEFISSENVFIHLHHGHEIESALAGFCKVLRIEKPVYKCKVIKTDDSVSNVDIISNELQSMDDLEIYYQNQMRYVKCLIEVPVMRQSIKKMKKEGVYLITGGAGGLGLIITTYLVNEYQATVILIGRNPLDSKKQQTIDELNQNGRKVHYFKCDITEEQDCIDLADRIDKMNLKLNGLIHAAGIIRDAMIIRKTPELFSQVLSPKIDGAYNLVKYFDIEHLDFMLLCSSTTSILGNLGQCDYAYANNFLDNLARNLRMKYELKIVSVNWPFWKDGGMQIDEKNLQMMKNAYGIYPLETSDGLQALEYAIASNKSQLIILPGDKEVIRKSVRQSQTIDLENAELLNEVRENVISSRIYKDEEKDVEAISSSDRMEANFRMDFLKIVSDILKLNIEDIDLNKNLSEYGFDSISFTDLASKINDNYDLNITPAIFFGYSYLDEMVKAILAEHNEHIGEFYKDCKESSNELNGYLQSERDNTLNLVDYNEEKNYTTNDLKEDNYEPIAIIGMYGTMPQSENLDEFWHHVKENHDLVTEIPKDRWDWEEYFGDPHIQENKTNVKWGAFMNRVDEFDPTFFRIAGYDSELMDPQERMVLQTIWHTMEDAGYSSQALSDTDTGVFIGISSADYKELLLEHHVPTMLTQTFISNRVSYILNLHGPSEPVDTACSSSIVAIHKAIEAIHKRQCKMAFAGGINIMLTPNLYITESKTNMLSMDGKCKTFDESANGYVRGEGIATFLLKPLKDAIKDKDHIYGVIKGSAINHGGRASNIFAPNAKAQSEVIIKAWEEANIDPTTISYIEAHGTGTSLGDPIEIEGIKRAYQYMCDKFDCKLDKNHKIGIGSVKTNIGHLEAASGAAGLVKILYALKEHLLPNTLHFQKLNPFIKFEGTPFEVVNGNRDWMNEKDSEGKLIPRRAALSSFGVGGINAHIVIEEYINPKSLTENDEELIILSAKDSARLFDYVDEFYQYLNKHQKSVITKQSVISKVVSIAAKYLDVIEEEIDILGNLKEFGLNLFSANNLLEELGVYYDINLRSEGFLMEYSIQQIAEYIEKKLDIHGDESEILLKELAYTLQIGRDEFKERVAFVARDIIGLMDSLKEFSSSRKTNKKKGIFTSINSSKLIINNMDYYFKNHDLNVVALLWTQGNQFNWSQWYESSIQKVSAPVYPFAKERYWFQEPAEKQIKHSEISEKTDREQLTMILKRELSELLHMDMYKIDTKEELIAYGMNSITYISYTDRLKDLINKDIDVADIITCESIDGIANYILNNNLTKSADENAIVAVDQTILHREAENLPEMRVTIEEEPISIIKCNKEFEISGFEEFWSSLRNKQIKSLRVNCVSQEYFDRLVKDGYQYIHLIIKNPMRDMAEMYVAGDGKPLVIITGVGMTPGLCKYQISQLSCKRRVICFSMPGVGLSQALNELSLSRLAKFVIESLACLGIHENIDLLGVSWGSLLVTQIAYEYRQKIDKMILGSPICRMKKTHEQENELDKVDVHMKADFLSVDNENGEMGYELFLKSKCIDYRAFKYYAKYFGDQSPAPHETYEYLNAIDTETLILYGDLDQINSMEEVKIVHDNLRNCTMKIIKGAAHIPMVTHALEFNQNVDEFLG